MAESGSSFNDNIPTTSVERSSKRKMRNESEKRRRDAFNRLIAELTTLVVGGDRKMDKSSVLKCAINFLTQHHLQAESTSNEETLDSAMDQKLRIISGCTVSDIVQLYVDALAAGTFCVRSSGYIEHASTSFAALFDKAICELQGTNLFDLLDSASSASFSGALSTELNSLPGSANGDSTIIQHRVITRGLRRQLLIKGYLKKTTYNTHCSVPDTGKNAADECAGGIGINEELDETLRFVGVALPLSGYPVPEITLETMSSWERRNASFSLLYNNEFIFVDAKCCQLLGYNRIDLLGTSGYDYIHTDDLPHVAESHTQLMKLDSSHVPAHRLRAKSNQWIWVNCSAVIESRGPLGRVRCSYCVMSVEDVRKSKESTALLKANSTTALSQISLDCFVAAGTPRSSKYTDRVSSGICPVSSVATPSPVMHCIPGACSSEQNSYATSTIGSKKSRSCAAKIVVEPLSSEGTRKRPKSPGSSNQLANSSPSTSPEYTSPQEAALLLSPTVSPAAVSPKRCNRIPVAFIERYPLSNSTVESTQGALVVNGESSLSNASNPFMHSAPAVTSAAALSISPVYRRIWEELQRRSEILRQQVLQKEMELRDLHLQKFLALLRDGDKQC